MSWNGSGSIIPHDQKPVTFKSKLRRGPSMRFLYALMLSGAAFCTVFILFCCIFMRKTESERPERNTVSRNSPRKVRVSPVKNVNEGNNDDEDALGEECNHEEVQTNEQVATLQPLRTGSVMTLMDGTVVTNVHKAIFQRDFERALMVSMRPGGFGASQIRLIRKKYTDEQILSMLKEMTIPGDSDEEDVVRVKNKVQQLKEEILLAIADGASITEILDDLRDQRAAQSLLKARALQLKSEALRSGDPEVIRDTVTRANEVLQKNGVMGMTLPSSVPSESEADTVN